MTVKSSKLNENFVKVDFYSYWNELTEIKILNPSQFKKIRQNIRSSIIKVLTIGIEDKDDSTVINAPRRVLSANEINLKIDEILGFKVKRANLYFHLQILEELGVVQIVGTVTHNKKITSYYGRTAKAFVLSGKQDKEELKLLKNANFLFFIKKLNPKIPENEINEVLENLLKIGDNEMTQILSWVDKYGTTLQNCNINFVEFFQLITFLKIHNHDVRNALNQISELLLLE